MKVSSRAHYGLRAMTELAKAFGGGPLALSEIARVEGLPATYLEQLMAELRKAGLVEGLRGLHGGYTLTRRPSQITVGEVVRILEGPIAPVDCTAEDYAAGSCHREPDCLSRSVWQRVKESIDAVLDATTLQDLVDGREGSRTVLPTLPISIQKVGCYSR
ncbi:MAG TPA: Rrf2 family transcriptional regulator [Myxococcales bacterium]|nr:Rrf2 family transcriptional regulator [Myxococcales bacterium]